MSRTELLEASGPWWAPVVAALLIVAYVAGCWGVVHVIPLLVRAHQRGRARLRAAHHTTPTTYRSHP